MRCALRYLCPLFVFLLCATNLIASELNPLAPPDTSSPRATLQSFQGTMGDMARLLREDIHLNNEGAIRRNNIQEDLAARCLDMSQVPIERMDDIGTESTAMLQEILDRIEIPPYEDIPDAAAVKADKLFRWTIPKTEITIARVKEGPREGEWLFSPATVARLPMFYEKVKDLPFRPDAVAGQIAPHGGLYQHTVLFPEPSFPSEWIDGLPAWARTVYIGLSLWKWVGIVVVLFAGSLSFALILWVSRRISQRADKDETHVHWLNILPPVSGVVIALLADELIDEQIDATGPADAILETGLLAIALIFGAWAIFSLGGIGGQLLIRYLRLRREGGKASMLAISMRIVSLVVAFWVLLAGVERLGLSVIPMLAGLGVGGFAIALAVRPTLENLIGGFLLFSDKPVRVGDFCRFGEQVGSVDKIGLRSTRIRTLEDTTVIVPNAEFAQLQLENISIRNKTLFRVTLGLRYETTSEQLRYVLAKLREMLIGHPKVSSESLRVRFRNFGDYSLDIEIYAYILTNDWPEYWAIREDLNLRIMDIVKEAGTGFAFPSQTAYLTDDSGLDAERSRKAEAQVEDWRAKGKLPFPEFNGKEQLEIENRLDYPPAGSSHYKKHPDVSDDE
jgi:MscS family membrane protein